MLDQIVKLNATLIIFCCIILSIFLIFLRSEQRGANRMLAGFLLLLAFDASGWVINSLAFQNSWLNALRLATNLLQMPLFLGFIYGSCFGSLKLAPKHIWHIIPFLGAFYLTMSGNQLQADGNNSSDFQAPFISVAEFDVINLMLSVQYYIYIAAAVVMLWQFRRIFIGNYSNTASRTYLWLCCLVGSSLFASVFVNLKSLAAESQWQSEFQWLQTFVSLFALCVVIWITLSALFMPHLFQKVDRNLLKQIPAKPRSVVSSNPKTHQRQVARLMAYMAEEQPFLEPELTLQDLSNRLNIPSHQLSSLLNNDIGESFFNFINRNRIEAAKTALLEQTDRSVTQIIYDTGFNSKSSFNTAFRKHTGMTPSQFRKSQNNI